MKKNVIFILSDQHRFCDVGYMGNSCVETPNLDKMARDGAFLTNMYSVSPLCVPARGSIFTGLHSLKHGAAANDMKIRPDSVSLAKNFAGAGYQTAYIGKWHLGGTPRDKKIEKGERLGFQYWRGCNCNHEYLDAYYDDDENVRYKIDDYEPVAQTDMALSYLKTHSENPFLLALCFGPPHDPYDALPEGALEKFRAKDFPIRENAINQKISDFALRGKSLHEMYAGYYAQISELDKQIGRILDWLKESGHDKDTIVVYTSDHGDMLGSHGFANKQLWYEESAKVPCVFYAPGLIPAGKRSQLVSLLDITPTLCGLCGVPFAAMDGKDESAVVLDSNAKGQGTVYFHSYVPCHQASLRKVKSWRAITNGTYKLVVDADRKTVALYDLLSDPYEMTNLVNQKKYAKAQAGLQKLLDEEVAKHDGYLPYEELLSKNGLIEEWIKSETYFNELWTFVPAPFRALKRKMLAHTLKKYGKGKNL